MSTDATKRSAGAEAHDYVRAWERTAAALELERLRALRRLSEVEAARQFATLLSPPPPYPLRPGSGLVEQQRIFSRLRQGRQ